MSLVRKKKKDIFPFLLLFYASQPNFITLIMDHAYFMLSLYLNILDVFNLEIIFWPHPTHQSQNNLALPTFRWYTLLIFH